ncbi:DUF647-domain-containing protein [Myriangium duriaei CBS 260.36]|uniref:DUF647-domain-containing protein n=1 Tax=Myriangium duriaei CBS 260.36 TaxID=1168546 RepID=A0A9P4MJU6_9PEZI|nr:DUF647-domain-containing protein [Myriangium duriaei CBS 260.36]
MTDAIPRIVSTDEAGAILATFVASESLPSPTASSSVPAHDQKEKRVTSGVNTHGFVGRNRSVRLDIIRPGNRDHSGLFAHLGSLGDARRFFCDVFLPAGWPHSVTEDYAEYQIYDSLQAFCSSIAGLLASRAVLEGVGVGDATASTTTAVLLSILQESLGRVTTIAFAHRLGTSLEPECKSYRLLADVFNDAAMILECLSPVFPRPSRVPVLACASALKALCGVAAGSSKASLSAHFARWGNLGELNAKDSSQETVISLLGMLAGSAVVSFIRNPVPTWIALLVLLAAHLFLNYRAVRAVRLRTLNRQRACIIFTSWVGRSRIPNPAEVASHERIFERDGVVRDPSGLVIGHCMIGVGFEEYIRRSSGSMSEGRTYNVDRGLLAAAGERGARHGFLLHVDGATRHCWIALAKDCTVEQQVRAWFTACRTLQLLNDRTWMSRQSATDEKTALSERDSSSQAPAVQATKEAEEFVTATFGRLWHELPRAGWDVKTAALETRRSTRFALSTDAEG